MKTVYNKQEIEDFAHYWGFHYDCCNPKSLIDAFCADMERGLRGVASSMPMIPSRLITQKKVKHNKTVLALDAGGTNMRAALISFAETSCAEPFTPQITGLTKTNMPGTKGRLSATDFFKAIADICEPLIRGHGGEIDGIGFCFSYAMDILPDGDGVPLLFSKEVDAPEVVGKPIGKNLLDELARRSLKVPQKCVLLNDTTATLLTGLVQVPASFTSKLGSETLAGKAAVDGGAMIGFILGTGFNTAYPETSIPKINFENKDEPQIVVCESGNFFNLYRGALDIEFDATTAHLNSYCTEKMCAGAYLGPLSLHILKKAVSEGLIKFRNSAKLLDMQSLQTRDMNAFLHSPLSFEGIIGGLFEKDEIDAIRSVMFLESIITERAGLFAAATLAATAKHINAGTDPLAPLRIAIEGTTYSIYHFLAESVQTHLRTMLRENGINFFITNTVDQASLLGAAVAALS
ncbi:MAG: hexokinase [Termitinemataceae bacterium]|nr:MAG: hexokinase [Termitinemataceae bacterium]